MATAASSFRKPTTGSMRRRRSWRICWAVFNCHPDRQARPKSCGPALYNAAAYNRESFLSAINGSRQRYMTDFLAILSRLTDWQNLVESGFSHTDILRAAAAPAGNPGRAACARYPGHRRSGLHHYSHRGADGLQLAVAQQFCGDICGDSGYLSAGDSPRSGGRWDGGRHSFCAAPATAGRRR